VDTSLATARNHVKAAAAATGAAVDPSLATTATKRVTCLASVPAEVEAAVDAAATATTADSPAICLGIAPKPGPAAAEAVVATPSSATSARVTATFLAIADPDCDEKGPFKFCLISTGFPRVVPSSRSSRLDLDRLAMRASL